MNGDETTCGKANDEYSLDKNEAVQPGSASAQTLLAELFLTVSMTDVLGSSAALRNG